jgi:hypothetical protein
LITGSTTALSLYWKGIHLEKETITDRQIIDDLIRGLWMLLFFLAARIVTVFVIVTTVFQFFCVLITRKPNDSVTKFGKELSKYAASIIQYLTYNTESKPWPFTSGSGTEAAVPEELSTKE